MIDTDAIRKTLDHYRKEREKLIEKIKPDLDKIREHDSIIRRLADDVNEPASIEPVSVDSAGDASVSATPNASSAKPAGSMAIRPDEFFGMSQSEAAKMYLRAVGRAVTLEDLVNALQAGGAKVGGTDPKRTLYVSLKANPKKEFVWPSKDHVGLWEFYQKRK